MTIGIRAIAIGIVVLFAALVPTGAFALEKKGELVNEKGEQLKTFKASTAGSWVLEGVSAVKVTCSSGAMEGTVASKKKMSATVALKGCKKSTGGTCKTKGAAAEEIKMTTKDIEVNTEVGEKQRDYLLYMIEGEEFECAETKIVAQGSFLIKVSAAQEEVLVAEFTVKAEEEKGKQLGPAEVIEEGGKADKPKLEWKVGTGAFEQAGQQITWSLAFNEKAKFI